ncbi:MAG TPA: germination protein YpeB [Bacillales bacterium]|nr:germination protein YpeB [Bacillales bacterium]
MARTVTIAVLAIVILATGYWGYQEHQQKNAVLIQAENQYQQAFHNLVYHVDQLQDQIGASLVMGTSRTQAPQLAEVWRTTALAHADVGRLPLSLIPFNDTEAFLSNIGEFSYRVSARNLSKQPLTSSEYERLERLYKRSSQIEQQLRSVQAIMMKNDLRWMDVKMALASGKNPADNTVIDGLKTMDRNVEKFEDVNWDPELAEKSELRRERLNHLAGEKISRQEAKRIAVEFSEIDNPGSIRVRETGKGGNYAAYSVSMYNPKTKTRMQADISKHGGRLLWMIQERIPGKRKVSLHEAMLNAKRFLKRHGIKDMEMTESEQYDDDGIFTFVKKQNGVRIYPESIRLKVSLTHGRVIAYDASNYIAFQSNEADRKPKMGKTEVVKNLNDRVDVKIVRPAVIFNDFGKKVLCYEIIGTLNNDTYRVFLNADTGKEEQVKKMQNPSAIYQPA